MGSLIAGLTIRFQSAAGAATPRFAARGDGPSDPGKASSPQDARAVHEALEFASPIDVERDGDNLVLVFHDPARAEQFLARLPEELADRVVSDGSRLTFGIDDGSEPDGEIDSDTESDDGPDDSEAVDASLSLADHQSHREPPTMHTDPKLLVPIENAHTVFGLPGSEHQSDEVYQHYSDTCAVRCQQLVLQQYGINLTQEELMKEASHHGWYEKGQGVGADYVGDLLASHGVPVAKYLHANVFNLTAELAMGHKVIIGVDSNDLWHKNPTLESMQSMAGVLSPDHAVIVSGIDTTDPDHVQVVVTDPGTGDVGKAYPMNEFLSAWKDSGFFMAATQVAAPLEFNPGMSHFDYKMGHLATIGHLPFDEFEHNFSAWQGIDGTDSILRDQAAEMFRKMDDHGSSGPGYLPPQTTLHEPPHADHLEAHWHPFDHDHQDYDTGHHDSHGSTDHHDQSTDHSSHDHDFPTDHDHGF